MLIGQGAIDACKIGVTIATRYACARPQFGSQFIMGYLTHQRRLLPALACAYGLHLTMLRLKVRLQWLLRYHALCAASVELARRSQMNKMDAGTEHNPQALVHAGVAAEEEEPGRCQADPRNVQRPEGWRHLEPGGDPPGQALHPVLSWPRQGA